MKGFTRSACAAQGSGGTRVFPGLQGSGSRLTISIMRRDSWQRELKNRMWQGLSHIGRSDAALLWFTYAAFYLTRFDSHALH